MKYTANILTILRALLAGMVYYYLVYSKATYSNIIALIIFLTGILTDYLDGYLAGSKNLQSDFGKVMDPISDKILILFTLSAFFILGYVKLWMLVLIAAREIIITLIRIKNLLEGNVMPAQAIGKCKTFMQMVVIPALFVVAIVYQDILKRNIPAFLKGLIYVLMLVLVAITLYSGFVYIKSLYRKVNEDTI